MIIKDQHVYDGSLLHKRFAYRYFRKNVNPAGNIIAFVAPMYVTTNLIGLEDSLTNDYIYSEKAINFLWEIPNLCPFGAVAFQRLFNTIIASTLFEFIKEPIAMDGDDIMVKSGEDKKASVSITYSANNVALGHTGINIVAGSKAPSFAYSTNLNDEDATTFMNRVIKEFNLAVLDIHIATSKVIV